MGSALEALKEHLGEINDLQMAGVLLSWDHQTFMPTAAAPIRAEQGATLAKVAHDRFSSGRTGQLLDSADSEIRHLGSESEDVSLVRVTRRDWERVRRVPSDLAAELKRASSLGYATWVTAKATKDFALFRPALQHQLELKQRYIACFPDAAEPFDALFDDYEPGMTAADVRVVFDQLKAGLMPLIGKLPRGDDVSRDTPLHGSFAKDGQAKLCEVLIQPWGFDRARWRLDETHHPFATALARNDVRLTTRYDPDYLGTALFGALHECGHGLYEAGVDAALERTPLARGCSGSLHESQSRFWENIVGRSRPYWSFAGPHLRSTFPDQLGDVDDDRFYRAANAMHPSLIRIEADETTYCLHIILRFELELDLLAGRLLVADLPEAWDAKMQEYLGIAVPDDARGVLQDVHWSEGLFGLFPVYALGNVISAQIWERTTAEITNLEAGFAEGEFGRLRTWLTDHLYRHGRKFTPKETVRLATGADLDPAPYLRYITAKVESLYGPVVS